MMLQDFLKQVQVTELLHTVTMDIKSVSGERCDVTPQGMCHFISTGLVCKYLSFYCVKNAYC